LNEFEQANINEALKWSNSKRKIKDELSEEFISQWHKRRSVWDGNGQAFQNHGRIDCFACVRIEEIQLGE
jgi:hypothetical protein